MLVNRAGYVGRVGALAVALGIGAAVTASPIALADEDTSGSTSASSQSDSASKNESTSPHESSSPPAKPAPVEVEPASQTSTGAGSDSTSEEPADEVEGAADTPEDPADPETDPPPTPEEPAVETGSDASGAGRAAHSMSTHTSGKHARDTAAKAEPAAPRQPVSSDPTAAAESMDPRPASAAPSVTEQNTAASRTVVTTPGIAALETAATVPAIDRATISRPAGATSRTLVNLARRVVDTVFAPLSTPLPTTPGSSPILLAVEWFRRMTVGAFYNRAPTATPLQLGEDADGHVIGTVSATDPDGDPLDYALAQGPARGSVVLTSNGSYTYTPSADLARDGGSDTFTVDVMDRGLRLFSAPGKTTVTVRVEVGAGDTLGINGTPYAVAVSPDGKHAYITDAANHRVSILDVATRAVTGSIAVGGDPSGIAIARDGRGYVVNAADGTVTVFDTKTNKIVRPYVYVGSAPNGIAVNAAGTRVVVANSYENSVSVIDTVTWNVTRVVVGAGPYGVAISGNHALVTNEYDDTVSVVDLSTNTVVGTIAVGDAPTGIAAVGNRAVVTNAGTLTTPGDGTVSIIDLDTFTLLGSPVSVGDSPVSVVIDASGPYAYIADVDRSTVWVLDIAAGTLTDDVYAVAGGPTGLALGADGGLYVAGYLTGTIDPVDVGAVVQPTAGIAPVVKASAAAAETAAAATQEWSDTTKGFDLYNDTAQNLTISYGSDFRPNGGGPAEGTVLAPGAHLHLEIPASWRARRVELILSGPTGESWTVRMGAQSFFGFGVLSGLTTIAHTGGTGTSEPKPDPVAYGTLLRAEKTTIRLLDKEGTATSFTVDDPRAAAAFTACASGSRAACSFQPAGEPTQFWTEWQTPRTSDGQLTIFMNGMDEPEPASFHLAFTQSGRVFTELGVKANLALTKTVLATITTPAGETVSSVKVYDETPTYMTPRLSILTLQMRSSWLRYTGDMTITVGNSRVTVKNMVFEMPDPHEGLHYATTVERMY